MKMHFEILDVQMDNVTIFFIRQDEEIYIFFINNNSEKNYIFTYKKISNLYEL